MCQKQCPALQLVYLMSLPLLRLMAEWFLSCELFLALVAASHIIFFLLIVVFRYLALDPLPRKVRARLAVKVVDLGAQTRTFPGRIFAVPAAQQHAQNDGTVHATISQGSCNRRLQGRGGASGASR